MTDYESGVPKNPWLSVSSPIPFCISTHNSDHFLPGEGFSNAEIKSRAIPEIAPRLSGENASEFLRNILVISCFMTYDIHQFRGYLTVTGNEVSAWYVWCYCYVAVSLCQNLLRSVLIMRFHFYFWINLVENVAQVLIEQDFSIVSFLNMQL